MVWDIETSQKVKAPASIKARSLASLRHKLQALANTYRPTNDAPPLGELHFRYELDENERPFVVHSFYYNRDGKLSRFIRLRRQ